MTFALQTKCQFFATTEKEDFAATFETMRLEMETDSLLLFYLNAATQKRHSQREKEPLNTWTIQMSGKEKGCRAV